jgi:uncharacterized protein
MGKRVHPKKNSLYAGNGQVHARAWYGTRLAPVAAGLTLPMPILSRRKALSTLVGAAVGTGLYTSLIEPHWLEIVFGELPVEGLSVEDEGKSLVQISDLHVGPQVDDDYIAETFRRVRELRPDFVVFTGDFVTYRGIAQFDQLQRLLRSAPLGRFGTFAILGNHDYGFDWAMQDVADRISRIARDSGIVMLRNQVAAAGRLQFVGCDDLWSKNFNPKKALAQRDPTLPAILLCHNPDAADRPLWDDFRGWILAGHTHGGQCKPPFLPPPMLPVMNRRYTAGIFELTGGRRMYINRGVGHLLRVRFNVRPEVTWFRLLRANPLHGSAPNAASLGARQIRS